MMYDPTADPILTSWPGHDEVPEHVEELTESMMLGSNPYNDRVVDEWAHVDPDNERCARRHNCVEYDRRTGLAARVGPYLEAVGPEKLYDGWRWGTVYFFPSAKHLLLCEECALALDPPDYPDTNIDNAGFSGDIADASWFIDRDDDTLGFMPWIGYFAADHGLSEEIELGVFRTVGEAWAAIEKWGAERNAVLDEAEAKIDEALNAWAEEN